MKNHSLLRSLRPLVLASAVSVAFASVSFGQATLTTFEGAGADTYLSNDSNSGAGVVHGSDGAMNVRAITDSRARLTLLRFDVSEYLAESLTEATVTVNFTMATRSRTWDVFGLAAENLDSWLESETNYSNGPGILSATSGNYAIDATAWSALGTFGVQASSGQQTTDVVSLNLDSFLTADTNGSVSLLFSFQPGTDTNPDWWMTSKEGDAALAPTLNLPNAQLIPEPSTYAAIFGLFALGGAVYLRRRKQS